MEASVPLYPLALAALGMAPLALGLWIATQDLAAHLNAKGGAV